MEGEIPGTVAPRIPTPQASRQPRALATLDDSCAHPELSLHADLRDLWQVQPPAAGPGDAAGLGSEGHRGGQDTGAGTGPGRETATAGPPGGFVLL